MSPKSAGEGGTLLPREGHQVGFGAYKGMRRKAWVLLAFGLVVAVVCTRATLTAVQQEAAVVQLAQELAASEAAVSCLGHNCHSVFVRNTI